jgi:hypothetical protein
VADLYVCKSGTSMAAPCVAGTVALMFDAAPRSLGIHETRALLLSNATTAPEGAERDRVGNGVVDIVRAVEAARAVTPHAGPRAPEDATVPDDARAAPEAAAAPPAERIEASREDAGRDVAEREDHTPETRQPMQEATNGHCAACATRATPGQEGAERDAVGFDFAGGAEAPSEVPAVQAAPAELDTQVPGAKVRGIPSTSPAVNAVP